MVLLYLSVGHRDKFLRHKALEQTETQETVARKFGQESRFETGGSMSKVS